MVLEPSMKKQAICMTLSCLFVAGAHAQSSVTLYGVIDEGFDYTNNVNGNKAYEMQSGYAQGSRWGLKGGEDLGGGVKAIFTLENGFNLNNGRLGQGGLEFGRQAFVGISDATYGTVTLGRQYDSVVDFLAQTTANGNWAGYLFAHPYDNDNTDNSFRVNNTVKYTSPTWAGFQFGGMYGFSNVAGGFANNRLMSVGAQYTYGGLLIAAAYLNSDNPSGTTGGAISTTDQNFLAQRLRVFGVGINYTMGNATVGFAYTNSNMADPTSTTYISGSIVPAGGSISSLKFNNFEINGKYQFTPAFFVGAQYVYTRATDNASTGTSHPNYQSAGLMADYLLSKRTDVYAQAAFQSVGGDSTGTALDQAYVPGAADASSTSKQVVVRLAIRHAF
jgi:predicted porin